MFLPAKISLTIWLNLAFHWSVCSQVPVILDTDPGYDPDDVGCISMLHSMASLGECEILAMINCTDHREAPLALSAINKFYNRGAIPVGDYRGHPKISAPQEFYSTHLAKIYPRGLNHWTDAHEAVGLYREILASALDSSTVIVITGTMHNFYALLRSQSCPFSPKNGVDLIEQKVRLVMTMGGNFIDGKGFDRTNWGGADALCGYTSWSCLDSARNAMCRYVIDHCPAPFMASGWEVGCGQYHDANYGTVTTGPGLRKLPFDHIARVAYEYHFWHRENKTDIARHSNDQCALHFAIRGEGDNYKSFRNGTITLSKSGVCSWSQSPDRGQGYIQKRRHEDLIAAEIEALMMGAKPELSLISPPRPSELNFREEAGSFRLRWQPVDLDEPGNWVVGYHVYVNGRKIAVAHGHQFLLQDDPSVPSVVEVRAVSAAGIEGRGALLEIN